MDIRSALESAYTEEPAEQVEKVEASEPVEKADDRPRDEAGRFAAKVETPEVPVEAAPEVPVRKAPSSWKPEAQTAWTKADKGEPLTPEESADFSIEVPLTPFSTELRCAVTVPRPGSATKKPG